MNKIIHTLFILKSSSPDKRRNYLYPKPKFWNYPATPRLHACKDLTMNNLNQLRTQRWLDPRYQIYWANMETPLRISPTERRKSHKTNKHPKPVHFLKTNIWSFSLLSSNELTDLNLILSTTVTPDHFLITHSFAQRLQNIKNFSFNKSKSCKSVISFQSAEQLVISESPRCLATATIFQPNPPHKT